MTNEIIILDDKRQITPTELFTPSGIDKILASIREKVKDFEPDMTTEKGRKEIASMAYKVARTEKARLFRKAQRRRGRGGRLTLLNQLLFFLIR